MPLQQKTSLNYYCVNFLECDRCTLNLLHPLRAGEKHRTSSQEQQVLAPFKQVLEFVGAIVVDSNRQVRFVTQKAEQLLNQYFLPDTPNVLPEPLRHWFEHQIAQLLLNEYVSSPSLTLDTEQAGRKLFIRLMPYIMREQYLLLLEERESLSFSIANLELLGLTKREAEVLFWIAKDKSNAGIAKVLGCSEGTIRKHLEHLYEKLGVQTRTGAVMTALQKLGLFKG